MKVGMRETTQLNGVLSVKCTIWWGHLPSTQQINGVPSLISSYMYLLVPPLPVHQTCPGYFLIFVDDEEALRLDTRDADEV